MKFCNQCGKQNSDIAKYCSHCGNKLEDVQTPESGIQNPEQPQYQDSLPQPVSHQIQADQQPYQEQPKKKTPAIVIIALVIGGIILICVIVPILFSVVGYKLSM